MSLQRNIIDDAITEYLATLFIGQADNVRIVWEQYQKPATPDGKGALYEVYKDLQELLPNVSTNPAIEISAKTVNNDIFSIGTQEEKGSFDIIITVTHNHPQFGTKYLRIVGKMIFDILNDFNNRSFTVPGYNFCVYYSEATDIDYGFRRGKGLRSAKITWNYKLLKPNRTTGN